MGRPMARRLPSATISAPAIHTKGGVCTNDIYVMNANGSKMLNLTSNLAANVFYPSWFPTANTILFLSDPHGQLDLYALTFDALGNATIPLWSALLARMVRSERLVRRQVDGVFLSLGRRLGTRRTRAGLAGRLGNSSWGRAHARDRAVRCSIRGLVQRALARYNALTVTTYAMVLAAALLAEHLTIMFVAGFGAVLMGVLLLNWPKRTEAASANRTL